MSKWDYAEKEAKKAASGGIFVTLQDDGDKVVGAFVGEPEIKKVVWTGSEYEDYDERKHDKSPAVRFKINFFNIEHNKMQIFETSATTFKLVVAAKAKYGFEDNLFEICRIGAKGDNKTTYSVLYDSKIDKILKERISNEKLHDLLVDSRGKDTESESDKGEYDNDISKIINKLKAMGSDTVKTFLNKFEIQKIRELNPEQIEHALSFIKTLENDRDGEVDPFA